MTLDGLDPVSEQDIAEAATRKRTRGGAKPAGRDGEDRGRGARERAEGRGRREEGGREARPPRREERPHREEREERPRGEPRREREDLGAPVRGFGDSIPAFMLIPIPRPRRAAAEPAAPAEAAPEPAGEAA
jgi:hypothetical protein